MQTQSRVLVYTPVAELHKLQEDKVNRDEDVGTGVICQRKVQGSQAQDKLHGELERAHE